MPPDADGDHLSDLNDPDDDNDSVPDAGDQYQLDPTNGTTTVLPWHQEWNPGDPPAGKFANSGFPGVQLTANGTGFIAPRVHVGGAGGFMSMDATAGSHQGATNSQDNALQVGFDATQPTAITTRITDALSGQTVEGGKYGGIFFGNDENNYVKLAITTDNGTGATGLVFGLETGGTFTANPTGPPVAIPLPGPTTIDLKLTLDKAAGRVTAAYRLNSTTATDAYTAIGSVTTTSFPGLAALFKVGAGAGIAATNTSGSPFGLAFDWFRLDPAPPSVPAVSAASASVTEGNSGTKTLNIPVTLSQASVQTVTVQYTTANWTATAGSDYVAKTGTLTFSPGQTTKSIPITINGDTVNEFDELFGVTFSNPTNATLTTTGALGGITNDDVPAVSAGECERDRGELGDEDVEHSGDAVAGVGPDRHGAVHDCELDRDRGQRLRGQDGHAHVLAGTDDQVDPDHDQW